MSNPNNQLTFDTSSTLSRVWLAAHWDKKLTKTSIHSHDIVESVSAIKAPGNVYSLRISGYLLLGIVKIYSKKSIITLEDLEQSLQSLTQTSTSQASEVLKEIGITDLPEKLKLIPKSDFLNPLSKPLASVPLKTSLERINQSINSNPVVRKAAAVTSEHEEIYTPEVDALGVTSSFLDDVEMAEQWLRKENDEELLPSKRPREKIWQNFIATTNVEDDAVVASDPPVKEEEEGEKKTGEVREGGEREVSAKVIESENSVQTPSARIRYRKHIVKDPKAEIVINPDSYSGLDCTADIVKNTRLYQPLVEILPNDMEQIFYIPILKDIAPELENFYLSHIKIQRIKNIFREEEEKEPVILSNTIAERPDNPIVSAPETVEIVPDPYPEPELILPKVEKVEERADESWSSRTLKLLKLLKSRFGHQKSIFFQELSRKEERRIMACGFYEVLQLCLKDFVMIENFDGKILLKPTDRLMKMSLF